MHQNLFSKFSLIENVEIRRLSTPSFLNLTNERSVKVVYCLVNFYTFKLQSKNLSSKTPLNLYDF
jgi:hypothetical protein